MKYKRKIMWNINANYDRNVNVKWKLWSLKEKAENMSHSRDREVSTDAKWFFYILGEKRELWQAKHNDREDQQQQRKKENLFHFPRKQKKKWKTKHTADVIFIFSSFSFMAWSFFVDGAVSVPKKMRQWNTFGPHNFYGQ